MDIFAVPGARWWMISQPLPSRVCALRADPDSGISLICRHARQVVVNFICVRKHVGTRIAEVPNPCTHLPSICLRDELFLHAQTMDLAIACLLDALICNTLAGDASAVNADQCQR